MITGELRNQVDKLWTEFWTGGITNPLMVIEQISFLMFREEKKANRTGKSIRRIFPEDKQDLRWSYFNKMTPADKMLVHLRDKVFPHFREVVLNGGSLGDFMKDAQ